MGTRKATAPLLTHGAIAKQVSVTLALSVKRKIGQ